MTLRASDRDRGRAVAVLKGGYTTGRLSTDTFEARVGIALTTRSRAVLQTLIADLGASHRALRALVLRDHATAPPMAVWVTLLLSQTDHSPVLAGRSNSCDLTLHSQAVSRRHAAFTRVRGCWYVNDLDSTNGTYVDEVRVERAPISTGTSVRLGDAFVEIA